jgi:hypothetical protein
VRYIHRAANHPTRCQPFKAFLISVAYTLPDGHLEHSVSSASKVMHEMISAKDSVAMRQRVVVLAEQSEHLDYDRSSLIQIVSNMALPTKWNWSRVCDSYAKARIHSLRSHQCVQFLGGTDIPFVAFCGGGR